MPLRFTRSEKRPSGRAGLMVATSKPGLASAAICTGGGGGSGIAQAVSGVAFVRLRGRGTPWLQVPSIEFPSALSLPSYVAFAAVMVILTAEPLRVNVVAGIAGDCWSML